MKLSRLLPRVALTFLGLALAGPAQAQFTPGFGPTYQPRTSPYLNLLRTGTSPGINYYGIVRPELEFRSGIQQVGQQTLANQQAITGLAAGGQQLGPPTTGHIVGFQNHLSYFQNIGAPGQNLFGVGLGGPARGAAPAAAPSGRRR